MFSIELLEAEVFRNDAQLINEIFELVKPSYEDPTAILQREIQHCNKLYVARLADGALTAFFMVAWEILIIEDEEIPCVFLGLSATSQKTKNSGNVRMLYSRFIEDAQKWEAENLKQLILWHTTATPSVFNAINLLFANNEPDDVGNYSAKSKVIAQAICLKMQWNMSVNPNHPFVLHNIAKNTRYSAQECARIEKICREKSFVLFEKLKVIESNGDRLLRISNVPVPSTCVQPITMRAKL